MTTLDELRRANLKEQKSPSPVRPPKREPDPEPEPEAIAVPEIPANPVAVTPAPSEIAITAAIAEAAPASDSTEEPVPVPKAATSSDGTNELVERVRASIARKRLHPTGVKATVDMPPELFWRVKRYCRDHSNATVRQVFLDLMIAYLDEEGY